MGGREGERGKHITKAVARKKRLGGGGGGGELAYCACVYCHFLQGHFYLLCTVANLVRVLGGGGGEGGELELYCDGYSKFGQVLGGGGGGGDSSPCHLPNYGPDY